MLQIYDSDDISHECVIERLSLKKIRITYYVPLGYDDNDGFIQTKISKHIGIKRTRISEFRKSVNSIFENKEIEFCITRKYFIEGSHIVDAFNRKRLISNLNLVC